METARAVEVATRVEVKREHENDEEYDYDYGGEHDSAVYSEPGWIRKGSGSVSYWIRVSKTHAFGSRVGTERERELGERKRSFCGYSISNGGECFREQKERWSLGTSEFEDANVDHLLN